MAGGNVKVLDLPAYTFTTPCTLCVSGTTGAGKTEWVKRLIRHKDILFSHPPTSIYYFYGVWQKGFESLTNNVEFREGLPSNLDDFHDKSQHEEGEEEGDESRLFIIDDQMQDVVKSPEMERLFTRESHHRNISVIYITQNLFCQGKHSRDIALNCHYIILLRNPRDVHQISILGTQTGMGKGVLEAYKESTSVPYGYLVVDLSPHNLHPDLSLKTHIFPDEDTVIYSLNK